MMSGGKGQGVSDLKHGDRRPCEKLEGLCPAIGVAHTLTLTLFPAVPDLRCPLRRPYPQCRRVNAEVNAAGIKPTVGRFTRAVTRLERKEK